MSLSKRKYMGTLPTSKKKRKAAPAIEEIVFDASAREDYLSGFHKRKLQRIKHARGEAAKREREERLNSRRLLREERKAELEKQVAAVNSMVKDEHDSTEDGEDNGSSSIRQCIGIQEAHAMDREDEYVDEEALTTVTVEAVDVSKDGLHKYLNEEDDEAEGEAEERGSKGTFYRVDNQPGMRNLRTKELPAKTKRRKKKFRYESKAERKFTRQKERAGRKAKAMLRKS